MSPHSLPLVERLRHGLASAVLTAAALAAPSADAASAQQPRLAQSPASTSRPATPRQPSTAQQGKPPKSTASVKPKTPGGGKGSSPAAAGCGAHDGGCGPSR